MHILLCVGEGLGNVIQTLPLAKALKYNGHTLGILNLSYCTNDDVAWLFSSYGKLYDKKSKYDARIELATTKGNPKHADMRLNLPLLNNLDSQFIYGVHINEVDTYLKVITESDSMKLPENPYSVILENFIDTLSYDFVVHNGCSITNPSQWERKKYPYMKELVEKLLFYKNKYKTVASIGAKHEYIDGVNETNKSLQYTASLIKNSKFFISNDTGTFHLAAALKIPGVAIFTATSIFKNYHHKFHDSINIIKKDLVCQPCQYSDSWKKCTPIKHKKWRCREIKVSQILKEIEDLA